MHKRSDILPIRQPRSLPRSLPSSLPGSLPSSLPGRLPTVLPADLSQDPPSSTAARLAAVRTVLDKVMDPEIPVLSIAELGILQDVELQGESVIVTITPTYSGCPAMTVVEEDIAQALATAGYSGIVIKRRLSPAWTTDWMSASAREKLRSYGIAPPCKTADAGMPPSCPRCGSLQVREISAFGSTACKALFQCRHCAEPFDYFKPY